MCLSFYLLQSSPPRYSSQPLPLLPAFLPLLLPLVNVVLRGTFVLPASHLFAPPLSLSSCRKKGEQDQTFPFGPHRSSQFSPSLLLHTHTHTHRQHRRHHHIPPVLLPPPPPSPSPPPPPPPLPRSTKLRLHIISLSSEEERSFSFFVFNTFSSFPPFRDDDF